MAVCCIQFCVRALPLGRTGPFEVSSLYFRGVENFVPRCRGYLSQRTHRVKGWQEGVSAFASPWRLLLQLTRCWVCAVINLESALICNWSSRPRNGQNVGDSAVFTRETITSRSIFAPKRCYVIPYLCHRTLSTLISISVCCFVGVLFTSQRTTILHKKERRRRRLKMTWWAGQYLYGIYYELRRYTWRSSSIALLAVDRESWP